MKCSTTAALWSATPARSTSWCKEAITALSASRAIFRALVEAAETRHGQFSSEFEGVK